MKYLVTLVLTILSTADAKYVTTSNWLKTQSFLLFDGYGVLFERLYVGRIGKCFERLEYNSNGGIYEKYFDDENGVYGLYYNSKAACESDVPKGVTNWTEIEHTVVDKEFRLNDFLNQSTDVIMVQGTKFIDGDKDFTVPCNAQSHYVGVLRESTLNHCLVINQWKWAFVEYDGNAKVTVSFHENSDCTSLIDTVEISGDCFASDHYTRGLSEQLYRDKHDNVISSGNKNNIISIFGLIVLLLQ